VPDRVADRVVGANPDRVRCGDWRRRSGVPRSRTLRRSDVHTQRFAYRALLFLKETRFDAPLPWTPRQAWEWFTDLNPRVYFYFPAEYRPYMDWSNCAMRNSAFCTDSC
jgi:hypothetical protein